VILSQSSEYWKKLISGENIVVSINEDYHTFAAALKYAYTSLVDIGESILSNLIEFADKNSLPGLKVACFNSLISHLTPENAATTFELALQYNVPLFTNAVTTYIKFRTNQIKSSKGFKKLPQSLQQQIKQLKSMCWEM